MVEEHLTMKYFFDGMSLNNPFPEGKLKQAIDKEFGSLEKIQRRI